MCESETEGGEARGWRRGREDDDDEEEEEEEDP